jgi:predicted nucleic acid-binding protein
VPLVVDASFILAIALNEEAPAESAQLFDVLAREGAWVPPIWRYEVANALAVAARRGRIQPALPALILADIARLPIHDDPDCAEVAWSGTLALATQHRLSVYDASYLELAVRKQAWLATNDRSLAAAAQAEGLTVVPQERAP